MKGKGKISAARLGRTLAVLLAMVGTWSGALVSAPAQAATSTAVASCYGASCAGKDPSAMGCTEDGYTVDVIFVDRLGRHEGLELRYSRACNANWARLRAQTYYGAWVSMCVVNDANRTDVNCTESLRNNYWWGPMIDGNKRVFASVDYSLDSGGAGAARTRVF